MRNLTHYEIIILIKNEVTRMHLNANNSTPVNVLWMKGYAQRILKYIEEYDSLEKED